MRAYATGVPSIVPIPKFNRIYLKFLPQIDTRDTPCDLNNPEECSNLYRYRLRGRVRSHAPDGF